MSQDHLLTGTRQPMWPVYVTVNSADLLFLLNPLFLFCLFANIEFLAQICPVLEGVLDKTHPQLGTQAMKITSKYDHCLE